MKKIAVVLSTEPRHGGGHQYAHLIMEALMENQCFQIVGLVTNTYWLKWCRKNNIVSYRIVLPAMFSDDYREQLNNKEERGYNNLKYTKIGKILESEKIDLVFQTQQQYFPYYGLKSIFPVHDLMHIYEQRFPEVADGKEYRDKCLRLQAKYASCLLTDSQLGVKQFRESFEEFIGEQLRIIPVPYVVPKHIMNDEQEIVLGIPSKFIFYPAQFWKHKNHINLLKASALVKTEIPDICLVLVGSEKNAKQEIVEYIQSQGLDDNVIIKGFVSDAQITYLYRHAIGMVMPSYFGPTNIPPLEAMALGCPVAVSSKYAMPEQVGNAGLLFNPDSPLEISECIYKIWKDVNLREQMIKLGFEQIRKWTSDDFKNKILDIVNNNMEED